MLGRHTPIERVRSPTDRPYCFARRTLTPGPTGFTPDVLRTHTCGVKAEVVIRQGDADDIPAVMGLLDQAGEWLVAQGRTGQWGTARQSESPRRQEQAATWGASGGLFLATLGGAPVGALVVGLPSYFELPPSEPYLYVNLVVTSREHKGLALGAVLLDHARALARAKGIGLLRLDCYDGDDRKLVRYYESQGFEATTPLQAGGWPGRLMEQKLTEGDS